VLLLSATALYEPYSGDDRSASAWSWKEWLILRVQGGDAEEEEEDGEGDEEEEGVKVSGEDERSALLVEALPTMVWNDDECGFVGWCC